MPHRGSPDEDGLQVSVIHNHGSKGLAFFNIVRVFIVASRVTFLLDQLWVLGQGSDKQKLHFSFVFQQWSGSRLFKGVKKGK